MVSELHVLSYLSFSHLSFISLSSLFFMAVPQAHLDRAFGVTKFKSHIPIILDLDDHKYDVWRELFHMHCLTFDVFGHIDGPSLPTGDNDADWHKRDGFVKLWLYGTLAHKLFLSSFKTDGTTRDIWIHIENQFRNNKEARAIQLDNELCTTEISDMTIQAYCQKLKWLSDLLTNVDAPVTDITLVMYLLNGLNEKFDNIINVLRHREPFPSLESAQSMLEMEEKRVNKSTKGCFVVCHCLILNSSRSWRTSQPTSLLTETTIKDTRKTEETCATTTTTYSVVVATTTSATTTRTGILTHRIFCR